MSHLVRAPRRLRVWVFAAIGALAVLLVAPYAYSAASNSSSGSASASGGAAQNFTIKGNVTRAVWPGALYPINLAFTNPNTSAIKVGTIKVSLKALSAPNADATHACTLADFRVKQIAANTTVNVGAKKTLSLLGAKINGKKWPAAGLKDLATNQDGCKGATLTLSYSARGTSQ